MSCRLCAWGLSRSLSRSLLTLFAYLSDILHHGSGNEDDSTAHSKSASVPPAHASADTFYPAGDSQVQIKFNFFF